MIDTISELTNPPSNWRPSGPGRDDLTPQQRERVEEQKRIFDKLTRVSRRGMPALEYIHYKFARSFRLALFNMIRTSIGVRVQKPEITTYGEFVERFPERTNINIVNIRSLRGIASWCLDPRLIYIAIDNMFGGEGKIAPRSSVKEYTAAELRVIHRLMETVLHEYEKAWRGVHEMKFDLIRQETNFAFAKITSPEDMVVTARFTVDINGRESDIDLCIPFSVLEPLKGIIYENIQNINPEPDDEWIGRLRGEVMSANVQAVAVLARKEMRVGEILSLSVGEIIPIEIVDPITVYVDGLPVIRGKYGVKNGRYSVKVEEIKHPSEYLKAPLEHGRLGPSMMRGEERGELYERNDSRAGEIFEAALKDLDLGPDSFDLPPLGPEKEGKESS